MFCASSNKIHQGKKGANGSSHSLIGIICRKSDYEASQKLSDRKIRFVKIEDFLRKYRRVL